MIPTLLSPQASLLVHATPEKWTVRAASTPKGGEGEQQFVRSVTVFAYAAEMESCPAELSSWFDDWHEKVNAWWLATPWQSQLDACTGALGLHLLSRFDLALRAWRGATASAAPPPAPVGEAGCDFVFDGQKGGASDSLHLPEFPKFPDAFQGVPPVIPIPRLLPNVEPGLLSRQHHQQQQQSWVSTSAVSVAGGMAIGVATGAAVVAFATRRSRRGGHAGAVGGSTTTETGMSL